MKDVTPRMCQKCKYYAGEQTWTVWGDTHTDNVTAHACKISSKRTTDYVTGEKSGPEYTRCRDHNDDGNCEYWSSDDPGQDGTKQDRRRPKCSTCAYWYRGDNKEEGLFLGECRVCSPAKHNDSYGGRFSREDYWCGEHHLSDDWVRTVF